MGARRTSGLLWLALVLVACIVWLGVLQWRWVREASEAEQVRMKSLLDARVAQFAQDFDRRITNLYSQFVALHGEARAPSLAERAGEWLAQENAPAIVSAIYAVHGRPGVPLRLERFDPAAQQFAAADWPDSLRDLRERLARGQPDAGARPSVWRVGPRIDLSVPAVVIARPVLHLKPSEDDGVALQDHDVLVVVAVLDVDVLTKEVLPDLARRHFAGEPGVGYRVLVREEREGAADRPVFAWPEDADPRAFEQPDASAHILRVRNEFFDRLQLERVRVAGSAADGPEPPDRPRGGGGRMQLFLSRQFVAGETVIVVPDAGPPPPRWEVAVVHSEGSLALAVARSRRWNLGLSLGVLALLGASVSLALVASQRAQRLARERVEFVAGVSHELRTPLAVIRSAAENLADGVVDEPGQVQRYGTLIADEGRKLSGMIDQVLDFAGLEAGQALRVATLDPRALVDHALAAAGPMLAEHGVEVDAHVDAGIPALVGDRDALTQAIVNLVSNAAKHAGEARWIGVRVTGEPSGGRVRIAVQDRGPGIPAHEQKRIFEPFFRGAGAVAAQVHGSGLGLSLVKRIAERHGGRVEVTSRPGHGSTFALVLPARGSTAAERLPADTHAPAHGPR